MKIEVTTRQEHQFRDDFPKTHFKEDYYIGLDWIIENESAILVTPKIENLSYLQMFLDCFNCDESSVKKKLKEIYHIDFERKAIKLETEKFELTPLLIVHFLKLTDALAKKGLKRDYILEEENLSSKIKGKIVFSQHLKKNLAKGRQDRIYCRYQDYSVDCVENRIIKKTLLFVNSYLNKNQITTGHAPLPLQTIANSCLAVFAQVSDDISIQKIKKFKINPLYREYAETLKVAKLILKRFGYAIENANEKIDKKLPPFWIDMALLFEVYVLNILKNKYKGKIIYQAKATGRGSAVDFLYKSEDKKIIIDTKYKPIYSSKLVEDKMDNFETDDDDKDFEKMLKEVDGRFKLEDIAQLSRYARDKRIRKKLVGENEISTIIPCLIIYPLDKSKYDNSISEEEILRLHEDDKIPQFLEFYKFGIKLPLIEKDETHNV